MSLIRGAIGGVVGYAVGALILVSIRVAAGNAAWEVESVTAGAWLFALSGWLLGVGVWRYWAAPWFGRPERVYDITGWKRYFAFDTDHKVIGIQYLVTFLTLFFMAGLFAMLMRWELFSPGRDIMAAGTYNSIMSLHGTMMIFVAVAGTVGSFGNYVVPIMIGADDMAFPKLNALSYWLVPPVLFALTVSFLTGGYDTGWTGYAPLSVRSDVGGLFYNLAFFTLGLSSIIGAVNFVATIVTMRAPGMGWFRMPIFVWSIFVTTILALVFTQFIAFAMLMVILDRTAGTVFFDPASGGQPLLYQHIFWFYSHPAVYIMILPALGITLEMLSHFTRKPLFGYRWAVGGLLGIMSLSMVVWAHHMFTSGMPDVLRKPFMVSTEIISIPTGFIFLSAVGTLWLGRIRFTVPMLFALGVLFNFLIGGITGIFLADVPVDIQLQDTYFVVAHFHYVILGGGIFGLFGATYYWFPKMTGRMMSARLGKVHFWWMMVGFNATFLPMFTIGMDGMNRRIADYTPNLADGNRMVSMGGFFLGTSFVVFLYNFIRSWISGPQAPPNPWGATTLEWQTASPPPHENFDVPPVVVGDPYGYGDPDSVHFVFPEPDRRTDGETAR
ncbi:MAG: cbb3-type cytochrome c oxidase subunit I [Acidimicrobiales bacterium]|nr:cbb3-type cytochrome c oxidase subunit I [Acidimicrobiales bacterium]